MKRAHVVFIITGVAAVLGSALIYWAFFRGTEEVAPPVAPVVSTRVPVTAPEPEPEGIELPSLENADEFVRKMLAELIEHPRLAAMLTPDLLVYRFVAAIDNIAHGRSPARNLPFFEPNGPFRALQRDETIHVDPRSYSRYEWIADLISEIDTAAAVRLYLEMEPLFNEAYTELGRETTRFRDALDTALSVVFRSPVPDADVELLRPGIRYEFADEKFEALSPASKHLIRMGPSNARRIQAKLHEVYELLLAS